MLSKNSITLSNKVYIDEDILFVLNFAKTICILNNIEFPNEDLLSIKSMKNQTIETSKYNLDVILFKAYQASLYVIKSKKDNDDNTCNKFIKKLDILIDEILKCPKL